MAPGGGHGLLITDPGAVTGQATYLMGLLLRPAGLAAQLCWQRAADEHVPGRLRRAVAAAR